LELGTSLEVLYFFPLFPLKPSLQVLFLLSLLHSTILISICPSPFLSFFRSFFLSFFSLSLSSSSSCFLFSFGSFKWCLTMRPGLASNSQSSCLSFPSDGITGLFHHTQLVLPLFTEHYLYYNETLGKSMAQM
jgi:hypothetical protein